MKVLSLFDGMSVAQQAISELYKDYDYYASEIDEYAIAVTQSNFPNTIQLGSVEDVYYRKGGIISFSDVYTEIGIDLLIGGSPCQDLSIAKKNRKGLDGERSGLFYEYVRIRDEVKPKYFILENVASMSKEAKQTITDELFGIEPVMINASLVSAQNRKRLFWVGRLDEFGTYQKVEIPQPEDKGILLKDILEENVDEKYYISEKHTQAMTNARKSKKLNIPELYGKTGTLTASYYKIPQDGVYIPIRIGQLNSGGQGDRIYSIDGKSTSLSANDGVTVVKDNLRIRKLTPIECLRLQSMPDNFFDKATYKGKPISNTQRYKMCGNAFNKEVIKHIIKQLNN